MSPPSPTPVPSPAPPSSFHQTHTHTHTTKQCSLTAVNISQRLRYVIDGGHTKWKVVVVLRNGDHALSLCALHCEQCWELICCVELCWCTSTLYFNERKLMWMFVRIKRYCKYWMSSFWCKCFDCFCDNVGSGLLLKGMKANNFILALVKILKINKSNIKTSCLLRLSVSEKKLNICW